MSDRFYYDLDPYHDLIPDRDYDIYSRNEYARSCQEDLPQWRPHDDSGMYTIIAVSFFLWCFHTYSNLILHNCQSFQAPFFYFFPFFHCFMQWHRQVFLTPRMGNTMVSPNRNYELFKKSHLSIELPSICLNNLKFF